MREVPYSDLIVFAKAEDKNVSSARTGSLCRRQPPQSYRGCKPCIDVAEPDPVLAVVSFVCVHT